MRLCLAALFGGAIGVERQWHHKTAGVKTNTLITIGAACFALLSNSLGAANHNPGQIAASVVTGIGFVGAGVIIHRGASIQGVNTASTLWAAASVGIACGFGFIKVAVVVTALVLFVQFITRWIAEQIDRHSGTSLRQMMSLAVVCDRQSLAEVRKIWSEHQETIGTTPSRVSATVNGPIIEWRVAFASSIEQERFAGVQQALLALPGVKKVETAVEGYDGYES